MRVASGDIIADVVMAGVTMLHWDFRRLMRNQADKQWNSCHVAPLADRTLGVVGLGAIGATIARRAKSAGMTVVGSKRDISVPVEVVDRLFDANALSDLLPLCDFLVLALPATPETVGLIGAAEIARMKTEAFLINIPGEHCRGSRTHQVPGGRCDARRVRARAVAAGKSIVAHAERNHHAAPLGKPDELYGTGIFHLRR